MRCEIITVVSNGIIQGIFELGSYSAELTVPKKLIETLPGSGILRWWMIQPVIENNTTAAVGILQFIRPYLLYCIFC